jgi:hypothetical protein
MGIDSQIGYAYDITSGVGPMMLTLLLSLGVFFTGYHAWKAWTCGHSFWCLRHGKHALADPATGETHHYCWKHHPGGRAKRWTAEEREKIHARWLAHQARQHQPPVTIAYGGQGGSSAGGGGGGGGAFGSGAVGGAGGTGGSVRP